MGTQRVPAILMGFAHTPLGIAMHPKGTRNPIACGKGVEFDCVEGEWYRYRWLREWATSRVAPTRLGIASEGDKILAKTDEGS